MPNPHPEHFFGSASRFSLCQMLTQHPDHVALNKGHLQTHICSTKFFNWTLFITLHPLLSIFFHGIVSYIIQCKALSISFKTLIIISSFSVEDFFEKVRLLDLFYLSYAIVWKPLTFYIGCKIKRIKSIFSFSKSTV